MSRTGHGPLYWSVRRELWENRSLYVAPLVVESVFLAGFLISTITLPRRIAGAMAADAAKQREIMTMPFSAAAFLMIVTLFVVSVFYCLDALHGERRDRSILFWKSLPVSDRTAVLAKAGIPMVVLPLMVFAIVVIAQAAMLLASTLVLLGDFGNVAALWRNVRYFESLLVFFYGLVAIALWHAPLYAWLLLVSAWAKRAPVLWAVLPPLAIAAVERVVFGSAHVMRMLGRRVTGWFDTAFVFPPKGTKVATAPLAHITPGEFLSSPTLWFGLFLAALFLAAAVRLRRNREPI